MRALVLLLAWVMSQGQSQGQGQCGGMLSAPRGVLQTPNFPRKFAVPQRCHWIIDASQVSSGKHSSIIVYFTQLFVTSGLTFTEFDYYEHDSTFQLGGREIHRVTEQNVTSLQWLMTPRQYLVVDFSLERLEGNHLRVLDDMLDVYGFNITYEIDKGAKNSSCSVIDCSMSGHCYASYDFKEYYCSCFHGFSGPLCGLGPLCQPAGNVCENGATCRQVGAIASTCQCPEGFTGAKCDVRLSDRDRWEPSPAHVNVPRASREQSVTSVSLTETALRRAAQLSVQRMELENRALAGTRVSPSQTNRLSQSMRAMYQSSLSLPPSTSFPLSPYHTFYLPHSLTLSLPIFLSFPLSSCSRHHSKNALPATNQILSVYGCKCPPLVILKFVETDERISRETMSEEYQCSLKARYEGTLRLTNVSAVRQCLESTSNVWRAPVVRLNPHFAKTNKLETLRLTNVSSVRQFLDSSSFSLKSTLSKNESNDLTDRARYEGTLRLTNVSTGQDEALRLTNCDRARYEGTLRLTNVSAVRQCLESSSCSLKPTLSKQITKYLRSSNLSIMEDLRVLDVGFSGEVRFHFWGGKSDGSRVRESLNRLVQRGRLGNVTLVATHLAITQEPTLHLQSLRLNHPKMQVRQGEEFVLSCIVQGSSHLSFRWFKDGVFVNITKSRRTMWSRLLPLDSSEQYTALLGVERADPLDKGVYTCQVTDWGYQQCRSVSLEVLQVPRVRLDPMSITVEKGENVTIKCTSPNELEFDTKFGYSWTKNNALFKMTPEQEFWEDLFPGGSLLRIYNVQKSATYTCHVHGSVRTVSRSMRLEMLNHSVVPWCPADETGVGGIQWERAGPGVVAKVECPAHYTGVATRLCLLGEGHQARWQTPDFSDCVSDKITAISNNFHKVTLGFGNTTAMDAVFGVLTSLRDRGVIYPGEGEPAISLLHRVATYLNLTAGWEELANSTSFLYSAVNTLLLHRNSIINHQKVEELQQVVSLWSGLWGAQGGTGSAHLAFDSLVVDMFRYEEPSFRRGLTLHIPRPTLSYPPWLASRVLLHVESDRVYQNATSSVAIIVYHRLSEFLPQRYSQTLENGSEVQYEIASEVVAVVARGPLVVLPSLELAWNPRPGWQVRCASTGTSSSHWNLTACRATPLSHNHTLCHCPVLGTYAAMLVKVIQNVSILLTSKYCHVIPHLPSFHSQPHPLSLSCVGDLRGHVSQGHPQC
ncbi:hypothetical protein J6590_085670 [Homalodisca vitripennis]|nr:hypothetical protein J6590_085670 [Homalodisca vitripennis]